MDFLQFAVLCHIVVVIVPTVADGSCTWHILTGIVRPTHCLIKVLKGCTQDDEVIPIGRKNTLHTCIQCTGILLLYSRLRQRGRVSVCAGEILLGAGRTHHHSCQREYMKFIFHVHSV